MIEIQTYTFSDGSLKEKLYEVTVSGTCVIIAHVRPDFAPGYCKGKQNACLLSSAGPCIHIDHKHRLNFLLGAEELVCNARTVSGESFEIKEYLKANGFRWDPTVKVWTKDEVTRKTKKRLLKPGTELVRPSGRIWFRVVRVDEPYYIGIGGRNLDQDEIQPIDYVHSRIDEGRIQILIGGFEQ